MAGSRLPGPVGIEILTGSGIKPVERAGRSGAAGSTPGPLKESKFSLKEKELFFQSAIFYELIIIPIIDQRSTF